jgi:hypothetical protein
MPEATIHKDRESRTGKCDVDTDSAIGCLNEKILPKAKPLPMEQGPQFDLGPCVASPVALHDARSGGT